MKLAVAAVARTLALAPPADTLASTIAARGQLQNCEESLRDIIVDAVSMGTAVPVYYDRRYHERFVEAMKGERFADLQATTIGQLIEDKAITLLNGHGSPGREERVGDVPYIKVSDRARAW